MVSPGTAFLRAGRLRPGDRPNNQADTSYVREGSNRTVREGFYCRRLGGIWPPRARASSDREVKLLLPERVRTGRSLASVRESSPSRPKFQDIIITPDRRRGW